MGGTHGLGTSLHLAFGSEGGACTSARNPVSVRSVGRAVALSPQSAPGPLCHLLHDARAGGLAWGWGGGSAWAWLMANLLPPPSSPDFY